MNVQGFRVIWPDGSIYSNRHGETVLTETEAKATAQAIGGHWCLTPLPADETLRIAQAIENGQTREA